MLALANILLYTHCQMKPVGECELQQLVTEFGDDGLTLCDALCWQLLLVWLLLHSLLCYPQKCFVVEVYLQSQRYGSFIFSI
jgi:hypothetical protein